MKINIPASKHYAEEFQTHDIKFAFLNRTADGYDALFYPFKCRDFLIDAVYADTYKKDVTVFGFSFNGKTQSLDKSNTLLYVGYPTSELLENTKANISKLNNLEKLLNLNPTTIEQVPDELVLIFTASVEWQRKAWTISLYSFLIKCLALSFKTERWLDEVKSANITESQRLKSAVHIGPLLTHFHDILKIDGVTGFPLETSYSMHLIHDRSGFVSICSTSNSDNNAFRTQLHQYINNKNEVTNYEMFGL